MRSVLVVDPDGGVVAMFPEWDRAHEWAELRVAEGPSPVRVEDLRRRVSMEVWPEGCRLTRWRPEAAPVQACLRAGGGSAACG